MVAETPLSAIERQLKILGWVEQRQRVTIPQLIEQFAISPATARRDLDALAEQGKVQRVHGGALALRHAPPEAPVLQRMAEQADEKTRIARAAAELIREGETVFISSGTTALEVTRQLSARRNLTVITNSLLAINALANAPDITLIVLGGLLRRSEMSYIGHITEQALAEVRADKVIFGIRAIDIEHGLTNDYLQETVTDRAILKIGREVITVADSTKLGRVSTAFVAPLTAMHTLITDSQAPPEFVETVKTMGIRVITA
ncbi:MAG: DeoR/GlpR family DNA-binding transcription regulator [Anaerolineales bacterium]